MSDTIPVEKDIAGLCTYKIFILKIVQFALGLVITILPLIVSRPQGHMYCIASGPTVVISLLFIILYMRRKVPLFMEKMYLFFQIMFTFGAFIQCFLLNLMAIGQWLTYGLTLFALLTALSLDLFLIANERGCTFSCA